MKKKVQIFVACHKPSSVYKDDVYVPIHVGRTVSNVSEGMLNMIGDDTGENISSKNPFFCELTAQYWIWKNIKDTEYVGLCHYRRYFETKITSQNVDAILGNNNDVLQISPRYEKISIGTRLKLATCQEDFFIFYKCLLKLYPEYKKDADYFLSNNVCIPYNMFLMKKNNFDCFAEWQFSILFEMEKYVKLSSYTRMRRVYGYISEAMLAIYCKHNNLKVTYRDVVSMIGEQPKKIKFRRIKEFIRCLRFKILGQETYFSDPGVEVGFEMDGIKI